jgi:hypothetical protein
MPFRFSEWQSVVLHTTAAELETESETHRPEHHTTVAGAQARAAYQHAFGIGGQRLRDLKQLAQSMQHTGRLQRWAWPSVRTSTFHGTEH